MSQHNLNFLTLTLSSFEFFGLDIDIYYRFVFFIKGYNRLIQVNMLTKGRTDSNEE